MRDASEPTGLLIIGAVLRRPDRRARIGTRHRTLVALQWAWSYVTFGRGVRLIVGSDRAP